MHEQHPIIEGFSNQSTGQTGEIITQLFASGGNLTDKYDLRVENGDGGDVNREGQKLCDYHQVMPRLDSQGYH